jgi:hypothetical protein
MDVVRFVGKKIVGNANNERKTSATTPTAQITTRVSDVNRGNEENAQELGMWKERMTPGGRRADFDYKGIILGVGSSARVSCQSSTHTLRLDAAEAL